MNDLLPVDTFISEKDSGDNFLARTVGLLRSLGHLFPKASLSTLSLIACTISEIRPPTGRYRVRKSSTKKIRGGTPMDIATRLIIKRIPGISNSTCQNHIDLLCDMRIVSKGVGEYGLHSYGKPLVLALSEKTGSTTYTGSLAWRCYFLDRLLYEDGDSLIAVLSMHDKGIGDLKSIDLGLGMRRFVLERVKRRLSQKNIPESLRHYLATKLVRYDKAKTKLHTFRRTELEYTVRREWLVEMGLLHNKESDYVPTTEGRVLLRRIKNVELDQQFFNNSIFSMFSDVFDLKVLPSLDIEDLLEDVFTFISRKMKTDILETMVLINTAILRQIPRFVGDRARILDELRESDVRGSTALTLESGYRTPCYFVKNR